MPYTLDQVNQMSQATFVEVFGPVFEHTPAIAAQAWNHRPFNSRQHLHQIMAEQVQQLAPSAQVALICAHPDLGSKAAMADASLKEQAGAGLNQLSAADYERFQRLNQAYTTTFGFPFIVAVKNHTKASILDAFEQRLRHTPEVEQQQALTEIIAIAHFRLMDLISDTGEG